MREVWSGVTVEEKNLTENISILRQALGDSRQKPVYIKTVFGQGYRFVGEVTVFHEDEEDEVVLAEQTRARVLIEEEQEEVRTSGPVAPMIHPPTPKELPAAQGRALPLRVTKPALLAVGLMLALGGAIFWQRNRAEP